MFRWMLEDGIVLDGLPALCAAKKDPFAKVRQSGASDLEERKNNKSDKASLNKLGSVRLTSCHSKSTSSPKVCTRIPVCRAMGCMASMAHIHPRSDNGSPVARQARFSKMSSKKKYSCGIAEWAVGGGMCVHMCIHTHSCPCMLVQTHTRCPYVCLCTCAHVHAHVHGCMRAYVWMCGCIA